jgi:hypothetical protein
LTADERSLVVTLVEEAEDQRYSREHDRAFVSAARDERRIEDERWEAILDYAGERA